MIQSSKENLMTTKYILTITLLSSVLFFQACSEKENKETQKVETNPITQVKINTLKKQMYPIWVNFSGKTQAIKNVDVSSKVKGELKTILFIAGEKVKKGQALFQIDKSEYTLILLQKQAVLKKNQASLNLALANVNRYKPLVQQQLAPAEKLDELLAKYEQLKAQVSEDKAVIKRAELDISYTLVKAPIKGNIGKATLDIGNIITSSTVLTKIVQSDFLYVNFNPSANIVSLIQKYKSVKNPKVKVMPQNTNNDLEIYGELDFVDNIVDGNTGTVALRARINNKNNIIFPGTIVDIKLLVTNKEALLALSPNTISRNQLGAYVYIVNKQNTIEIRQIEISYSNKDLLIIKSGLKQGDKVIISALNKLKISQEVIGIESENPINIKGL